VEAIDTAVQLRVATVDALIAAVALLVGDADVEGNARDRRIDLDCLGSSPQEPILRIGWVAVFGSREMKPLISKDWRRGRDSPRPLKTKANPLVLRIGLKFSQLYWGLFSAIQVAVKVAVRNRVPD
jgi:hypothetical protein